MIYAGKKEDTRLSVILAVILHVIIFLLIFFCLRFELPDPPPSETFAELSMADFGYTDTGSGNNEGAPTQTTTSQQAETPEEAVVDETSDVSSAVTDQPSTSTQTTTATQTQTQQQTQQQSQQTASSALTDALSNMNSGGDGNDNTGGNVGTQSGKIDGKGVFGNGLGSYNLSGRKMTGEPNFQGKPKKDGRVVVKIVVNRSGKVTRATVDKNQSNTTEQSLWDLAVKNAKNYTFNSDSTSDIEQRGTLTFTFKVK